jgi:hypothetical protein
LEGLVLNSGTTVAGPNPKSLAEFSEDILARQRETLPLHDERSDSRKEQ